MAIKRIKVTDTAQWHRLRRADVTASVVGALFNAHDFVTPYALWASKTGRAPEVEETPAMQRGRLLEPVAVQLLSEQHPDWTLVHNAAGGHYFRDPDHRIGGTPDVIVTKAPGRDRGVIQIKSVEASVYRRKWLVDGEPEAPLWIALQATLEAYLTGAKWAAVGPLVVGHGVEMPLIEVPLVEGVIDAIKIKAGEFWRDVAAGNEPPLDYERDGALLDHLYADGDEEEAVDLTTDERVMALVTDRAEALAERLAAEKRIAAIDAEVKAKMGDAVLAYLPGGRRIVWRKQRRPGGYVAPSNARTLRYPTI